MRYADPEFRANPSTTITVRQVDNQGIVDTVILKVSQSGIPASEMADMMTRVMAALGYHHDAIWDAFMEVLGPCEDCPKYKEPESSK